jgi:hypothetical protein
VESAIRNPRIQTYRAQLAVCETVRAALSKGLENANLADHERIAIGHRRDEALKERHAFEFMLDLLERRDREANLSPV